MRIGKTRKGVSEMKVFNQAMRARDNSGAVYAPYAFSGDFTDEERAIIESAISRYVPMSGVTATFNNWLFSRFSDGAVLVQRATWESHCCFHNAEQAAQYIKNYYRES